jgi:prepilin peptidase CpaA
MWLSGWRYDGNLAPYGVLLLAALGAALWDARTRRIPNVLTFPLFLAGLTWSTWAHGMAGLLGGLVSAVLMALPCLLLFLLADGGAGDVKLMAALGAWLAPADAIPLLAYVALAGLILGVATAALQRRLPAVLRNIWSIVAALTLVLSARRARDAQALAVGTEQMHPMPFGIPILCGVCVAAVTQWFAN